MLKRYNTKEVLYSVHSYPFLVQKWINVYTSTSLVWFLFLKHPKHLNEIHFFINKFINGKRVVVLSKQYHQRATFILIATTISNSKNISITERQMMGITSRSTHA